MVQKPTKSSQMPAKSRGFYTPKPVQQRIIARYMSGQSNRQIASQEGMDRETVSRILSQEEVTELTAQYQSQLLSIVPKAIRVYEEALESDDFCLAFAAATKLMEGMRVLGNGFVEQPPEQPDRRQQKLQFLGLMLEMMLEKNREFDVPLPPELARLAEEPSSP